MQKKELVIQKLQEVRDKIPEMKPKGVMFRGTAEFSAWRNAGAKWLKLGLPHTRDELEQFQYVLDFAVLRVREGPDDYDYEDQEAYEKDCELAVSILNSAIENLQIELVTESPRAEATQKREREHPKYGVGQAETVIMGEGNIVNIVDTITVSDFLNVLEREIEAKVADAEEKKGLRQRLKEISQNPAANTVMGQALGALLRGAFGG